LSRSRSTGLNLLNRSETFCLLRAVVSYLPPKQFRSLWILLLISSAVGFADLVFVGLIAKLVGSFSGSSLADNLPFVRVFGGDALDRGLWIVVILLGLIWISTALKFAARLVEVRVSSEVWAVFGNRVYSNLILQSYEYYKNSSSMTLMTRLNRVLSKVSDNIVIPMLSISGNVLSSGILAVGVVIAFGWIAVVVFGLLVFSYALSSFLITPRLRFLTRQQFIYSRTVNQILLESTRSIRDIHLHGAENFFISRFGSIGSQGKRYDRLLKLLPDIPRFVIEPTGVTVLFAIGLLPPLLNGGGVEAVRDALPALMGVIFASLRLAAPMQSVSKSINKLRGSLPDLSDALDLLEMKPVRFPNQSQIPVTSAGIMPCNSIKLSSISYRYGDKDEWALRHVDVTVPIGARVALVGTTGGGKTTAAHLLLGLLTPQEGQLLLDGVILRKDEIQAWQQCCAFVPQNIKLLDASVRENIAFGVGDDDVDENKLWDCLEMAQLAEFVSDLPFGDFTKIGEDGMRLSGGQRQRLALARAFYKHAQVLVLDEATSALDNKTENDVMESLELIGRRCTTIVIAHRLSTIRHCDRIYEFNGGQVIAHGNYEELQLRSPSFRELVELQRR
jgi:ATP-binding cassette subfamily B protein